MWRLRVGAEQSHEHPVKLFFVQVYQDFDGPHRYAWFIFFSPGQGVAITRAVVEIHAQVASLTSCGQRGIDPGGGSELIPHIVAALSRVEKAGHVTCQRSAARVDLPDHGSSQASLN